MLTFVHVRELQFVQSGNPEFLNTTEVTPKTAVYFVV